MNLLSWLPCLGPRQKTHKTLLECKQDAIVKTAKNCYEKKDMRILRECRYSYLIFIKATDYTRSEIYCRVIQRIKFADLTQDGLTTLTLKQTLWDAYCPSDQDPLRQYMDEIKTAILENDVKLLHKDYQTEEIKAQIEYLHNLVNGQISQSGDSPERQKISADLTFDIEKANFLLQQQADKSLNPAQKKKTLIKAKDQIKKLMLDSANINLSSRSRDYLTKFVTLLLEKYLNFEATNNIKVSLSEIYEILKDENLGKKLPPITLNIFLELVIQWASDKNRDPGLSEGSVALEIINDGELINGAGPFDNNRVDLLKKGEDEVNIRIKEVKTRCLKILLLEALSPVKIPPNIFQATNPQLALNILKQLNVNNQSDTDIDCYLLAVQRLYDYQKHNQDSVANEELFKILKTKIDDDIIISKLNSYNDKELDKFLEYYIGNYILNNSAKAGTSGNPAWFGQE